MSKDPAYEAYRVWIGAQHGGMVTAEEMWNELEPRDRAMWALVAKAAAAAAPPPAGSVDLMLMEVATQEAETKEITTFTGQHERIVTAPPMLVLKAVMPRIDRAAPDQKRLNDNLGAIWNAAGKGKESLLRVQLVTQEQRESEYQRLEPDGAVRQLEEGEGTW